MGSMRMDWLVLVIMFLPVGCSVAVPASVPAPSAAPSIPALKSPAASPTLAPKGKDSQLILPQCDGMQTLKDPVRLDWPNLEERKQEFISTAWQYYSCEQSPEEVAGLFRGQLPKPPYNMQETNWLERGEGTLGIYFSQTGLWHYVWFIPQPTDPQRSYVIVAESFASVEC